MRVLLIRPPDPLQGAALLSHTRPMNLAYLAAWLRQSGVKVFLADYEIEAFSVAAFQERLEALQPELIGISCTTATIRQGARLSALAKKIAPGVITVAGGSHVNGLPEETLREFAAFDVAVYGEGEETLLALCRAVQNGGGLGGMYGLVWRQEGVVTINPPRPLLPDLDQLPLPARDLFLPATQSGHASRGFSNRVRSAEIYTSRGCPFACSFCAIQTAFGRKIRQHSLDRVGREVETLVRQDGISHLVVADDTFTLDNLRAEEICAIFRAAGIASWNCDTRVSTVTPKLLKAMAQSGCRKVAFGVESGSQQVMDRIGKGITVGQVEQAVRWAREAGIPHVEGNFIIGADPGETREDIAATRALITKLPWTFVSVSIIVPYPGTGVYQQMQAAGQIDAGAGWEDFVMFGRRPRWRTDHFGPDELLALQRQLTRAFYLRPGYIAARLGEIRSFEDFRYWFGAGAAYLKWYARGRI